MKYLLDTNTCIRYLNGRSSAVIHHISNTLPEDIVLCSVVKSELYFGSNRSSNPKKSRADQDTFFARYDSLPFDDVAAEIAGSIRANLANLGTPIGPNDVLIAAIALVNNLTLVTHNTREFSRVNNLRLEDWEGENQP